jgi:hypothetical protein
MNMKTEWLSLCLSESVMRRALYTALIVGIVLIAINHGDAILRRQIDSARLFRMCLTVLVPYVVSTVSSVSTVISMRNGDGQANHG